MAGQDDLANERAVEREYAAALLAKTPVRPVARSGHGRRSQAHVPDISAGELLGRVALSASHPLIDSRADFYISSRYISLPELAVFSWAAPIACTYFRGTSHHELCDDVVAVRTFERSHARISGYADDIIVEVEGEPFARRTLTVPHAPTAVPLPRRRQNAAGDPGEPHAGESPADFQVPVRSPAETPHGMRGEQALLTRLRAPRRATLAPVLATLQPDQYSVTTAPPERSMILEGQPGTGKTVVAIHRAAYLVSPESSLAHRERVLLLGPSPQYVRHVEGIRDQLVGDDDQLVVMSMPELLQTLIRSNRGRPRGKIAYTWQDVDTKLGLLANDAHLRLRADKRLSGNVNDAIRQTYELLRANGDPAHPLETEAEWSTYLRRLPEYSAALERRSLQPLLAWICWKVDPVPGLRDFAHIIVDESQDVLPMEWSLLDLMNTGSSWTLLGDMNQRRSDHAFHTWSHVAGELGILDDRGLPPVHHLERGYRSTGPIIQYANRLLPRAERALLSLQPDGEEPTVMPVQSRDLSTTVATRAEQLTRTHSPGTTAAITVAPEEVRQVLRRRGWLTTSSAQRLEKDGDAITVLHPDDARGLEFDAVIVVEPSAFASNFGRQGPLYTALSRANRSLTVIHAAPLPDALKARRK